MSFTKVRPYFRTRMNSLGYKEWKDGFASDNVPDTIYDKAYHLSTNSPVTSLSKTQQALDSLFPMTVRLFLKGYRDPASAIDKAFELGQAIVCDVIKPSNSNGTQIHTVNWLSMLPIQLADSNDNDVILELEFECRILTDFR